MTRSRLARNSFGTTRGRRVKADHVEERAIVFFGHTPPDIHYTLFHREVARALGQKGWEVLWVSPPGINKNPRWWLSSARDRALEFAARGFRRAIRSPGASLARARKRLATVWRGDLLREDFFWDFRPWGVTLFKHPGFPPLDALAIRQMRRACGRLGMSRPRVLVYTPQELPFVRRLDHGTTAFWVGDEAMYQVDAYAELRALLEYVDLVFAISPVTFEQVKRVCPSKVRRSGTGVVLSRFDAARVEVASDLATLPGPIVGYAGAQGALRFDVELFCAAARAIPEATFVLVGPADQVVASDIMRRDLRNVLMLGPRPYAELGSYVTAFDVALVPYRVNDFNLGSNPLKVYEYLALGKPVVSVPLPAVEELGEVVSIAAGHDQFIAAIRDALHQDRSDLRTRRRAVAEAHSVERIVDGLIAAFEEGR